MGRPPFLVGYSPIFTYVLTWLLGSQHLSTLFSPWAESSNTTAATLTPGSPPPHRAAVRGSVPRSAAASPPRSLRRRGGWRGPNSEWSPRARCLRRRNPMDVMDVITVVMFWWPLDTFGTWTIREIEGIFRRWLDTVGIIAFLNGSPWWLMDRAIWWMVWMWQVLHGWRLSFLATCVKKWWNIWKTWLGMIIPHVAEENLVDTCHHLVRLSDSLLVKMVHSQNWMVESLSMTMAYQNQVPQIW